MKGLFKDIFQAMITMGLLIALGFWFGVGFYIGVGITSTF